MGISKKNKNWALTAFTIRTEEERQAPFLYILANSMYARKNSLIL